MPCRILTLINATLLNSISQWSTFRTLSLKREIEFVSRSQKVDHFRCFRPMYVNSFLFKFLELLWMWIAQLWIITTGNSVEISINNTCDTLKIVLSTFSLYQTLKLGKPWYPSRQSIINEKGSYIIFFPFMHIYRISVYIQEFTQEKIGSKNGPFTKIDDLKMDSS